MSVRKANAEWKGDLRNGSGRMALGSGAWEGRYSFGSRFEEGDGSNPEELIGAALAGCFSMALSNILAEAGHTPESVESRAHVHLEFVDGDPTITRIELDTRARVPGLEQEEFEKHAESARKGCPVSRALGGPEISVKPSLV
ncbi:MAG: OsmC family protein [Wenzhouxiangella sp.]